MTSLPKISFVTLNLILQDRLLQMSMEYMYEDGLQLTVY